MDDTSSSRSSPTPIERRLAIARILGPKGLRGGVRVELLTDWPEHLAVGEPVWLDGEQEPVGIARLETGGRVPVLYLEGVERREAAERLNGRFLEVVAKPLPEGSYYWADLVGMRVDDASGSLVGELVEVFRAGGNEVYRVVGPAGERLVPALRSAILSIDPDAGVMVVAADEAEEVG